MVAFLISFIILIYSAILHEIAHGFVADRLGDPTARISGRLTLNPKSHIDPIMTIFLPLVLYLSGALIIGGAKPVPVDPYNLKEGRKDLALVSLAGPLTNILLAVAAGIILHVLYSPLLLHFVSSPVMLLASQILTTILDINVALAVFNLVPIPPLDGSKLFAMLLPEREANQYLSIGSVGIVILYFLLLFPLGSFSLLSIISRIAAFLQTLLAP